MQSMVLGGDDGVDIRGKIKNQRRQRKCQGAQTAVGAAMLQIKAATSALSGPAGWHFIELLDQAACFARHQRVG